MTCAHFGPCGGCQLQDVPYPDQLTQKQATLAGLLGRRLGSRAPEVRPTIGMGS